MAVTLKRLGMGALTTANNIVTAYTVPSNNKTIVKSFVISNGSASNVLVTVRFGSTAIMYNYPVKPNDTIAVPVMDQLLVVGNSIEISSNASNSISYYISGIEAPTNDLEYSEVFRFGYSTVPVSRGAIVNTSLKDRIVKGIILCNTYASDAKVSIDIAGVSILQAFTIKPTDTILVPTMDLLIPPLESMYASASSGGVHYYITGKEL